ncbi:MAG TPA: hypothetical protein PLK82_00570 [Bacteroidales bacterium]|nr:hypothetical protein [Bacteroidales bacterium]
MKRMIIIFIGVLLVIAIAVRLKGNHDKINKIKADSGISSVVNVNVAPVTERKTGHLLDLIGTLYPVKELDIAAQVQGQITSLPVELGQFLEKGKMVAVIDNTLKELSLQSAKINEDKLKRDLERFRNLYQGGSATEQKYEEARIACESAKIQVDQAKKMLEDYNTPQI